MGWFLVMTNEPCSLSFQPLKLCRRSVMVWQLLDKNNGQAMCHACERVAVGTTSASFTRSVYERGVLNLRTHHYYIYYM